MCALPPPPPRGGLRPARQELAELLRLALPVAVVQVGLMLMGVVDSVMVGRVSATHLAAVALGNLFFFAVAIFGMGVLMALDPVISQAVGAGEPEAVARGVQRGGLLALGLSLVTLLLLLPAGPLLVLLGQPPEVVPLASGYVRATLPGILPFYLFVVLRQTLQALGRVSPVVVTILLANAGNAVLNWVLVFGRLGAPALGSVGAGWATSATRWLMLAALLAVAAPWLRPYLLPVRIEALRALPLLRLFRLGAPIGVQIQLEFGAFALIGVFMGWIGTVAMASHQIAINLASLTFMVPLGVAQASSVLVGRAVGRGDPLRAKRAAGAGLLVGGTFMLFTAALFLAAPERLARLYTGDATVIALAALLLPVAGVFQVFDGLQVVATAVLRGVGDTRVPMVLHVAGFWLVGLPVSLALGFALDAGPVGLWVGLAAGLGVVCALLLMRLVRRFSGELVRLHLEEAPEPGSAAALRGGKPAAGAERP